MTDQPHLRYALCGLAADADVAQPSPYAVARLARRLRRRRRARLAVGSSALAVVAVAGLVHRVPSRDGLVVHPAPPAPTASAPASATPGPTPGASTSPDPGATSPPADPSPTAGPPTTGPPATGTPSPGAAPQPLPPPPPSPSETQQAPAKPTCNLVVDAQGDAGATGSPSLDLLRGDLASDASVVVGVVRLASLTAGDAQPDGVTWSFGWSLGVRTYRFEAYRDAVGTVTGSFVVTDPRDGSTTTTTPVVQITPATAEVRWQVDRGRVPDLPAATAFSGLHAASARGNGTTATTVDTAQSDRTYDDRRPSCVRTTS